MTRYRVTSDRIVGHDRGDTVTAAQLGTANIEALVAGEHLEVVKTAKKAAAKKKGDN